MPKRFPAEFKRDVVAVARRRTVPLEEVAADFDISVSTLHRWMHQADVDDGVKDGLTSAEQAEIVHLRRENAPARDGERDPAAGGRLLRSGAPAKKMTYPLVRELAEDGIPVTVTCGVLKFSTQGYYKWCARPDLRPGPLRRPRGERHRRHSRRRPGVRLPLHLADELEAAGDGHRRAPGAPAVQRAPDLVHHHEEGPPGLGQGPGPGRPRRPRAPRVHAPADPMPSGSPTSPSTRPAEGKLYCCSIKDVFSNRIVGYAIGPTHDRRAGHLGAAFSHCPASAERNGGGSFGQGRSISRSELPGSAQGGEAQRVDGQSGRRRRQRRDGVVLLAAAEERPQPHDLDDQG